VSPVVDDAAVNLTSEQGVVDLDVEIAKCVKKLELASLNLDKVWKVESQPEYESTVPANVRLANEEKVSGR
jgi:valyl-tRNA synthetase